VVPYNAVDRQRASDLGVRAADVASAVRLMIAGEDQISTYKEAGEQYPVTMQLLPEQQKDPDVLARLMIPHRRPTVADFLRFETVFVMKDPAPWPLRQKSSVCVHPGPPLNWIVAGRSAISEVEQSYSLAAC
jgi:multidrug efflux pump subunit AcrB